MMGLRWHEWDLKLLHASVNCMDWLHFSVKIIVHLCLSDSNESKVSGNGLDLDTQDLAVERQKQETGSLCERQSRH